MEYDLIKINPAQGIKSLKEIKTDIHETLTNEEQTKVIAYLSEKVPNFLIFSKMLYYSGTRPIELLRLK